jgi:hypothetical protein
MSDMYGDDFDPITALATINNATERFNAANDARDKADDERTLALEQLNNAQRQFDQVAKYLRKHAPECSYWYYNRESPF